MPAYSDSLLAVVDQRVSAGQTVVAKMGTVTQRDSTGSRVLVTFDGSAGVAQPVKCFEDVLVVEGDRVGMLKVQSDWIIVGNYTLYTLADVCTDYAWVSAGTSTSAVYTDMPNSPTATFFKMRNATKLRIGIEMSLFATAAAVVEIGVNVSSGSTAGYDMTIIHFAVNTPVANVHTTLARTSTTPTADPSDNFTVTARWLRVSGTGTMTVDSNDRISINVREVWQ